MSTAHNALAVLCNSQKPLRRNSSSQALPGQPPACSGCDGKPHLGGRSRCPAFGLSCNTYGKIGHLAKVCHSKFPPQREANSTSPGANALSLLSTISHVTATDPAPKIALTITSLNETTSATVLGADISAANTAILRSSERTCRQPPPIKYYPKSSQWH